LLYVISGEPCLLIQRGRSRHLWAGKAGPFTPPRVASRGLYFIAREALELG
jgi:hypothetical protein